MIRDHSLMTRSGAAPACFVAAVMAVPSSPASLPMVLALQAHLAHKRCAIQSKETIMTNINSRKKIANLGVAWERAFGYVQAVQVKDTIYMSGQLSHDGDGKLIAPADLDANGRPVDFSQMEAQIRQTYLNAKTLLAEYGATLDDVVEETLFVLDVPSAFSAGAKVRKEMYGTDIPQCASNLIGVTELAFPEQIVEITFRAVIDRSGN